MSKRIILIGTAGLLALLDQVTKLFIIRSRPHLDVIPGFFNLSYVENTGAAFGILQGRQFLLSAVSVIAMGVLLFLLLYEDSRKTGLLAGLALILGGTCGNLIDRIRLGYVVDFLEFHIGGYYWPSFNIADSAISVGVGLLILVMILEERKASHEHPST